MNAAGAAFELAVRFTHAKHAVVRALALWETWIIVASVLYLSAHFAFWQSLAFRAIGK